MSDFVTPWAAGHQAPLSYTISWNLLIFISIGSVMLSNHLILCHPFLLLPSIIPSIRVFSKESALPFKQPKYWGVSALAMNIQSWFSFRIDWFDLAVQGTPKILLQHHNSKAILQCSAFFRASQVALAVKNLPANAGDVRYTGLIPEMGRYCRGGNGNPLPYSCLENPMDREAWRATVHSVAKSQTWLKQFSTAFFMVQLSHPYMTNGKTLALSFMDLCQQSDVGF